MVKHIFVAVLAGALFLTGVQFVSVLFYASAFDEFVKDEVKYAPVRESDSREHLVTHIMEQARFYSLLLDASDIHVERNSSTETGITALTVDVNYRADLDLYYFTSQVRRSVHAQTTY